MQISQLKSNPSFRTEKSVKRKYLLTCTSGLEEIVLNQIATKIPYTPLEKRKGRLMIETTVPIDTLYTLLCVDNIYVLLNQYPTGTTKKDLADLSKKIAQTDLTLINQIYTPNHQTHIMVNASRTGKQTYSRFEAAAAIKNALANKFKIGTETEHDLHFRIDLFEDQAYFSLKLTSSAFRFRSTSRTFANGAIHPSLANTLVWLSEPKKTDVFLDPFCGSGTIAAERESYPVRKIIATDVSETAVEATQENVSTQTVVYQADACELSLKPSSVTTIVTNLPWDVQIKVDEIQALYDRFLQNAYEMLTATGTCLVLTDKTEELKQAAAKNNFIHEELAILSIHGLHPSIVRLKKLYPIKE